MTIVEECRQPQSYSIRTVARATGLNAATIRTWERRYGLPNPQRTTGGHRQYSQRDIEIVRWLLARQEEGISISDAVAAWHSYIDQQIDPLRVDHAPSTAPPMNTLAPLATSQLDQLREQWIQACLAFDRTAAEHWLGEAFARFDPEVVCTELLQVATAQIGEGWYRGAITIQQEHFASALAVRRLEGLVAATPQPAHAARILVCCAPEDHHVFSPLLLTYLLLRRGWDLYYLGANVPVTAMEKTIAQIEPQLVILSAQRLYTAATLLDVAKTLVNAPVMVGYGGTIFNQAPAIRERIPAHFLGSTLQDAVTRVNDLLTTVPARELRTAAVDAAVPTEGTQQALAQYRARRTLIEAHIWGLFVAEELPTEDLMAISATIAEACIGALKLGEMAFAGSAFADVQHLLISYRPTESWLQRYLQAYHQAAKIHLSDGAGVVVDWLAALLADATDDTVDV